MTTIANLEKFFGRWDSPILTREELTRLREVQQTEAKLNKSMEECSPTAAKAEFAKRRQKCVDDPTDEAIAFLRNSSASLEEIKRRYSVGKSALLESRRKLRRSNADLFSSITTRLIGILDEWLAERKETELEWYEDFEVEYNDSDLVVALKAGRDRLERLGKSASNEEEIDSNHCWKQLLNIDEQERLLDEEAK